MDTELKTVKPVEDTCTNVLFPLCVNDTERSLMSSHNISSRSNFDSEITIRKELQKAVADLALHRYNNFCNYFLDYDVEKIQVALRQDSPNSLTYGEVDYYSFLDIMYSIKPKPGDKFFDLGCGTGKCIIATALNFVFLGSISGIEISEYLYSICNSVCTCYLDDQAKNDLNNIVSPAIAFHLGDILHESKLWTSSDILFINSTCFSEDLMNQISVLCQLTKIGSKIISLTSTLNPSKCSYIIHETRQYTMSWGAATCYIQIRT